eukprot:SM000009S23510  [mRNA]  locus=s9:483254:486041:+ [translate_table: standard]
MAMDHKYNLLASVAQSLKARVEAGGRQLEEAQAQVEKRKELLLSSCHVMTILFSNTGWPCTWQQSAERQACCQLELPEGAALKVLEVMDTEQHVVGDTLAIAMRLQSCLPKQYQLATVYLLPTCHQGPATCRSSGQPICNLQQPDFNVVLSVPISAVRGLDNPMSVNTLVVASIQLKDCSEGVKTLGGDIRTQVVHAIQALPSIDVHIQQLLQPLLPSQVPSTCWQAAVRSDLLVSAIGEASLPTALDEIITCALHMDHRPARYAPVCVGQLGLVAKQGSPCADATLTILNHVAHLSIRAMDKDWLAILQQSVFFELPPGCHMSTDNTSLGALSASAAFAVALLEEVDASDQLTEQSGLSAHCWRQRQNLMLAKARTDALCMQLLRVVVIGEIGFGWPVQEELL